MIRIKNSFFFFLVFSQILFKFPTNANPLCLDVLRKQEKPRDLKEIVTESSFVKIFQKSPSLIFDSKVARTLGTVLNGHVMSNECDIFRLSQVLPQRDLFIGIGNNASWDLALRSGAKKVVFYDINYEPLILQRYFFRALFEVSETPADFYKYLFLKASTKHNEKTTLKLIEEFHIWEDFAWFDDVYVDSKTQQKSLSNELLQKISEKSSDPEKEIVLDFVKKFQESYMNKELSFFPDSRGSSYDSILTLFSIRYFPTQTRSVFSLTEKEMESLYEGNATFLSSTENFQQMKKLMLDANYVVSSIDGPFWEDFQSQILNRFEEPLNGATFFTSNIFEVHEKTISSAKIKTQLKGALNKSSLPGIHIQTFGKNFEHKYSVQELNK